MNITMHDFKRCPWFAAILLLTAEAFGSETEPRGIAARPVNFDTGRERAVIESVGATSLGTGFVTQAAVAGDLVAVAAERRHRGETKDPAHAGTSGGNSLYEPPRTKWHAVNVVDVYRLSPDGSTRLVASIPRQHRVRLLEFAANTLLIGDAIGVEARRVDVARGTSAFVWKYPLARVEQVEAAVQGFRLRSADAIHLVAADDRGCRPIQIQFLPSAGLCDAGLQARWLVPQRTGQCMLYAADAAGALRFSTELSVLGDVVAARPCGQGRALVLDRVAGLRVFTTQSLVRDVTKKESKFIPRSFDDPRFLGDDLKSRLVVSGVQLDRECVALERLDDRVVLVAADGGVLAVPLDLATGRLGSPGPVTGLPPAAAVVGDKGRCVVVGRDGSTWVWDAGGTPRRLTEAVETGPWFDAGGRVLVAAGTAIHSVDATGLGPAVFRADCAILDIASRDGFQHVLTERELVIGRMEANSFVITGRVAVPADPQFVRVGPTVAAVVHGDRGLALVDVQDRGRPGIVANRELPMPTHSEIPTKMRDDRAFRRLIRDVLVEDDRLFVVGTEVFLYKLERLLATTEKVDWESWWHRPYVSADDVLYTQSIRPLGGGRYLVVAGKFIGSLISRVYVLSTEGDRFTDWEYCRLGLGDARDIAVIGDDGLTAVAAGDDGVRLLRLPADGGRTYLGSYREPGEEAQAVLVTEDMLHVKSGNTIRRYRFRVENATERTAFSFPPASGKPSRVTVDGLDVTSPEYAARMGYRNRLRLVPTDLSDEAGFPRVVVPQGTVAVDATRGRLKFADGRSGEPEFVSRSEHINVGLTSWRKLGPYHAAVMSEQSQGFGVLDLRDPACMRILAVAGQPNWFTYPHTFIGQRDGYAYITGNMFNCFQTVDIRDPLRPHYERMVNLEADAVTKFACPTHYAGLFRGDRVFVPCTRGLVEIDIADPENVRRVAVHERARLIHQFLADSNLAVRWLDGRLEWLDVTTPAEPAVIGVWPAAGAADFKPLQTVTQGGATWILAETAKRAREIVRLDVSDPRRPREVGRQPVAADTGSMLPEDGIVYLAGRRSFAVLDWRNADAPRMAGSLDERAFLGTWKYAFDEDRPRVSVVAGGDYGRELNIETKDGPTVWLSSNVAAYSIDVSDRERPKVVGSGPGFGESWWIRADDSDIVSIGSYRRGFIDIADPKKPRCLMEYWEGHPVEIGTPCVGLGGRYQVANHTVRRWNGPDEHGVFSCEKDVLFPIWFGPDPACPVAGKPACLIVAEHAGIKGTTVRSTSIAVRPGEKLTFRGLARTVQYPARVHAFDSSRSFDNQKTGEVAFSVRPIAAGTAGPPCATVSHEVGDGTFHALERAFTVPPGTDRIVVEIMVGGYGWFSGLAVDREGINLLANGDFDAQPRTDGLPADWELVAVAGGGPSAATEDALYLLRGSELMVYDLRGPTKLPVSRLPVQVHPTSDTPRWIGIRSEGHRRVAYVITYQGIVTVDVTDPRQPVKLGSTVVPWFSGAKFEGAFAGSLFIASQGYTSDLLTEGFYVFDMTDPARPLVRSQVAGRRTSGVVVQGTMLVTGDYDQGMQIWDLARPERPELVVDQGFVRCSQTHSIEWHGDHALHNEVGGLELWRTPVSPQAPPAAVLVE